MSKQTIWNNLRARGLSKTATAALMANIQAESAFFAPIVQSDFTPGYTKSILYTSQVDDGVISRDDFIHRGPGGGGYGLCQWTYYTRKAGLYDKAKRNQCSIGDEALQLDYLWEELHQGEYKPVLQILTSEASIRDMVSVVLHKFERPADQSEGVLNYRTKLAKDILNELGDDGYDEGQIEIPDQPEPVIPPIQHVETCVTEHRVLYEGNVGRDVLLLQAALSDMGYYLGDYGCDGAFGEDTYATVKKMQADCNLRVDGIAGEEVWQIIFQ